MKGLGSCSSFRMTSSGFVPLGCLFTYPGFHPTSCIISLAILLYATVFLYRDLLVFEVGYPVKNRICLNLALKNRKYSFTYWTLVQSNLLFFSHNILTLLRWFFMLCSLMLTVCCQFDWSHMLIIWLDSWYVKLLLTSDSDYVQFS